MRSVSLWWIDGDVGDWAAWKICEGWHWMWHVIGGVTGVERSLGCSSTKIQCCRGLVGRLHRLWLLQMIGKSPHARHDIEPSILLHVPFSINSRGGRPSLSRPRLRARVLLANSRRHRSHRQGPRRTRDLPLFSRRTKRTAETTPPCFNCRSTNAGAFVSASQSLRDRFTPHPQNSTTPASAISSSTTRLLNLTSNK